MPTLTVAGHSVTVGDEFLKLSPEEQNNAVDEIAKSLPAEKPSGVVAGAVHGASEHIRGMADTLKTFGGMETPGLDKTASYINDPNYKAAPLIKEGGHWYNPSDWNPGNISQNIAEQAPGIMQDVAVGGAVGKYNKWAGLAAGTGSMLLRTLGPSAKANAVARTGDENAEPNAADKARALAKAAVEAPINAVGLGKVLPGLAGKVAGVGMEGVANAAKRFGSTAATEGVVSAARDAVDQAGTTIGTDKGLSIDGNRVATSGVTGAVGGGALVAPRLAGNVATATKLRDFGGENTQASTDLANRQIKAADGQKLVSALGGTKVARDAVAAAHADVHKELKAASKDETLSQDNANTLQRIQDGGKASKGELTALATEASPDVVHLARQALLSNKLKGMGEFTDKNFSGGVSGLMDKYLKPLYNPTATLASTAAGLVGHAGALGMIGMSAPPVLATVYGSYAAARALDKLTGARSPAQGFTDKFADGNPLQRPQAPTAPPPAPVTTSVPQVAAPSAPAQPWGAPGPAPAPLPTFNPTALAMLKQKLKQGLPEEAPPVAPTPEPLPTFNPTALAMVKQKLKQGLPPEAPPPAAPAPEMPNLSPAAMAMLKQKLKQGLPAEAPPAAPEAPSFNPLALSMLKSKMKAGLPEPAPEPPAPVAPEAPKPEFSPAALAMLKQKLKQGLSAEAPPAPPAAPEAPQLSPTAVKMLGIRLKAGLPAEAPPAPAPAPEAPQISPTALSMLKQKMKQGLPAEPASPEIAAAMQSVASHATPDAPAAAPAAPKTMADILAGLDAPTPQAPVIAKIKKKLGKVSATPHEEPAFTKDYTPMDAEQLWGKGMTDRAFAEADAARKSNLKDPEAYKEGIVRDRQKRRGILADIVGEDTGHDAIHASDLLQELHHTRRADKASGAIHHFTSKMSPAMKAAIRKRMDKSFINSMWST